MTFSVIEIIVSCVERDRSDCQPSTSTTAISRGLRPIEFALGGGGGNLIHRPQHSA